MSTFDPGVIQSVTSYMNTEQPESCLYIVQGVGMVTSARSARLVDFDRDSALFSYQVERGFADVQDEPKEVRIPWLAPAVTRVDVRHRLFELLEKASDVL